MRTRIDLSAIALQIGIYYQLRDDYINLVSRDYHNERGFAEDISEGKYTLAMIYSLTVSPNSGLRGKPMIEDTMLETDR